MPHNSHRLILALLSVFLLSSCSTLDRRPLVGQAFYTQTKSVLAKIKVKNHQPAQNLQAGAARVEITPHQRVPLAGYGNRMGRKSRGTHDRLYTRALALSDKHQTLILITNDLLAITNELYEAVFQKISAKISLNEDALMITASHTHSGPGAVAQLFWETFATGPFDQKTFETITQQMAKAAIEAHEAMQPARLGSARLLVPELIQNRMKSGGKTDPELSLLFIQTQDGEKIFLSNFSAHATVIGPYNYHFSGDYPGVLQSTLEAETGGIALFTAGAVGDQGPLPPEGVDAFARARKMGEKLAEKTLQAAKTAEYKASIPISAVRLKVMLPAAQVKLGKDQRLRPFMSKSLFGFDQETVIQAFRVGNVILLGLPCDLSAEIGLELKARARQAGLYLMVVGFANDYVGYVIPEADYFTDAYEANMSFNGPYMGAYFTEIGVELIEALSNGS